MTKVTMNPAQQATAKAAEAFEVKDEKGRTITLKKPGVLAQFRLVELLGATASNDVYMGMVLPMIYVAAIDGDPVPAPLRKSEVEALIQRLDEEGVAAVAKGVAHHFGARDPEEDKAALKN
jgi:hypothetical protein